MTIKVEVNVFAPSDRQPFGGISPRLAKKTVRVEITRKILGQLMAGNIDVEGIFCDVEEKYSPLKNLLVVSGNLPDRGVAKAVARLKERGWKFNEAALKEYKL